MDRAISVTRRRSSAAPVERWPKTISSADRPPNNTAILSKLPAGHQKAVFGRTLNGVTEGTHSAWGLRPYAPGRRRAELGPRGQASRCLSKARLTRQSTGGFSRQSQPTKCIGCLWAILQKALPTGL